MAAMPGVSTHPRTVSSGVVLLQGKVALLHTCGGRTWYLYRTVVMVLVLMLMMMMATTILKPEVMEAAIFEKGIFWGNGPHSVVLIKRSIEICSK